MLIQKIEKKITIGLTEKTIIFSKNNEKEIVVAKIDTGATNSSIDERLASRLGLGPIIKSKMVKSAHGTKIRPVIEAEILLSGRKINSEFTLADRTHMSYKVLVGVNILKHGFIVDPSKK